MTIQEYILTYKGTTDSGKEGVVCNIPDYYDRYIRPIAPKFGEYSLNGGSRTVICPLHDDNDPSFGLMRHRFHQGVYLYHCFGCNATGTVIRLHQRIREQQDGIKLREEDACKELAELFNIPLQDFEEIAEDDYQAMFECNLKKIDSLRGRYTQRDFCRSLMELRKAGSIPSLERVNSACVKMIATSKQLYD